MTYTLADASTKEDLDRIAERLRFQYDHVDLDRQTFWHMRGMIKRRRDRIRSNRTKTGEPAVEAGAVPARIIRRIARPWQWTPITPGLLTAIDECLRLGRDPQARN